MCTLIGGSVALDVTRRDAITAWKVFAVRQRRRLRSLYSFGPRQAYTFYKVRGVFETSKPLPQNNLRGVYRGFYAFSDRRIAQAESTGHIDVAIRPVRLWGRVQKYANGYRAQFMKVL